MPLATALLQPTTVSRSDRDAFIALGEDIARVAAIMLEDHEAAGPLAAAAERALLAFGHGLAASIQPRRAAAEERLRGRFGGLVGQVQAFVGGLGTGAADAAAFVGLIRTLLGTVKGFADSATLPAIRTELAFWKALVEEDLGLSPAALTALIPDFLDGLRHELAAAAPADLAVARRLRLCDAALLRLRRLSHELVVPDLDLEPLARALDALLRKSGVAAALAEISCAMDGLGKVAEGVGGIVAVLQPPPAPLSAGVIPLHASMEYSWYASWLLADEDVPLLGLSDVNNHDPFIEQLTHGTGEFETLLRSKFGDGGNAVLQGSVEGDRLLLLLAVVNRLMHEGSLLDGADGEQAITEASLPDKIKDLRNSYRQDQNLLLFNRRIIEHFFGDNVDVFGGFWNGLADAVFPPNQVFVTGDRRFVMCDDKPIHMDSGVNWYDAPLFKQTTQPRMWFKFDHASPQACEMVAQVAHAAAEAVKATLHYVDIQPGHEAGGATVGSLEVAETLNQIFFGRPLSAWPLEKSAGLRRLGKWLDGPIGPKALSTLALTFQSMHSTATGVNKFYFYVTVAGGDVVRVMGRISMLNAVRDLVIGVVTLVNFGGPHAGPSTLPDNPARNHKKQGPVVALSDTLFAMALISLYPRDAYSIYIFDPSRPVGSLRKDAMLKHWLAGGVGLGFLAGLTGSFVAQFIAWSEDVPRFFLTGLKSAGKMFGLYWVYLYLFKENAADDGRYRPGGGSFKGYPDKGQAASPYLLPYPGGSSAYVGQGNLGFFSHNFITDQNFVNPAASAPQQTYAYDFGLDFQKPIACARAGTVFSFTEATPDSSTASANQIIIKHATIDPVHDDFGSGPVQTYAAYLHLATNGVTNAPKFGGTAPAPGTAVAQGDLIGLAGDTGFSFHNHLHMHVLPDDGTGNPGSVAIPFVFQDVGGEGVPKSLTWYRSGNR